MIADLVAPESSYTPKDRLLGIDMARGLAVVLVVFNHVFMCGGVEGAAGSLNYALTLVRMPVLLLISGALLAGASRTKLLDRARLLGWLVLVWTPLMVGAYRLGGYPQVTGLMELVCPNTEVWYLWGLAALTFSLIPLRDAPRLAVLAGALLARHLANDGVMPVTHPNGAATLGYHQVMTYGVFFYLGVYCAPLVFACMRVKSIAPLVMLCLAAVGFQFTVHSDLVLSMIWSPVFLLACGQASRFDVLGLFGRFVGRNTLPIFMGHAVLLFSSGSLLSGAHLIILLLSGLCLMFAALLLHRATCRAGLGWLYALPDFSRLAMRPLRSGRLLGERA